MADNPIAVEGDSATVVVDCDSPDIAVQGDSAVVNVEPQSNRVNVKDEPIVEVVVQGPQGVGVPIGGTTNQFLVKVSDDDFDTEWVDFNDTYRAAFGDFTFLAEDYHVEQRISGSIDTLPLSTSLGKIYVYSNVSGNNTTIQTTDSELITLPAGSFTTLTVYNGETYAFQAQPNGGWKVKSVQENVRDSNFNTMSVYIRGNEINDDSLRWTSPEALDIDSTAQMQRRATLVETDITLDAAKVASVEAGGFTQDSPYAASVDTDNRVNKSVPGGILGDQTNRFIKFNGINWYQSADVWFTRSIYADTETSLNTPLTVKDSRGRDLIIFDNLPSNELFALEPGVITFTPNTGIIRWEADWVGEGRVVQTLDQGDYPASVAGRIPLTRFRHYKTSNNVSVVEGFDVPDNGPTEASSENENNNDIRAQIAMAILYAGSDSPGIIIRNLAIEDRDGNQATFIDLLQAGSETFSKVILENVTVIDFKELGSFAGFQSVEINSCRLALYDKGFTFKDFENLRMSNNLFLGLNEAGATDVTIDGANGNAIILGTIWSNDDNAIAMDIKSGSTIDQGTVGPSTYKEPIGGQFFAPGSLDTTTVGWDFQNNGTLRNSNAIADFSASGNDAETVIVTKDVPVPINIAATGVPGEEERLTVNADGTITCINNRPENYQILLNTSVNVTPELEGAQTLLTVHIFVDPIGAAPAFSIKSQQHLIAAALAIPTPVEFTVTANKELVFGDVVRAYVANNTGVLRPVHPTLEISVRK